MADRHCLTQQLLRHMPRQSRLQGSSSHRPKAGRSPRRAASPLWRPRTERRSAHGAEFSGRSRISTKCKESPQPREGSHNVKQKQGAVKRTHGGTCKCGSRRTIDRWGPQADVRGRVPGGGEGLAPISVCQGEGASHLYGRD